MENATNPKLVLVQLFFIVGEQWKNNNNTKKNPDVFFREAG